MIVYCGGRFVDEAEAACLAPEQEVRSLGVYEEILFNGHMLRHVDAHMERLYRSLDAFGLTYSKTPVEDVAGNLLEMNLLSDSPAVVTVVYKACSAGSRAVSSVQVPRHPRQQQAPARLVVYPKVHQSHMGAHRVLCEMNHVLARAYANGRGGDDALLLDADGNVLEATTGGLVFSDGKSFVVPKSEFRLERIAQKRAEGVLPLREKPLPLNDALGYPHAYLIGSLFGMRPVAAIGETRFEPDSSTCKLASLKIL